jgi:hypothetical protein
MKRQLLILGLLTYSLLSYGQECQFKQPKNCRIEIILSDLYYTSPQIIGDTISISYFDNSGNKIKTINKSDGQIIMSTGFKYDRLGHLVESIDYGVPYVEDNQSIDPYLNESLITGIVKYEYENGLLKQINKFSHGNKPVSSINYKYDSKKRLISELSISYPETYYSLQSKEIDLKDKKETKLESLTKSYKYLKDKRICSYTYSSELNYVDTSTIKNGLFVKTISFDSVGHAQCEYNYKYSNNLLIEYSVAGCEIDMIPAADRFVYAYDKDGFLIYEYYYNNDQLLQKDYYIRIK